MSEAEDAQATFLAWFNRYVWDAVAFVREVLGVEPDTWQIEVLTAYQGKGTRQLSIRSGKGAGKSAVLSWIALHHLIFRFKQKTMVTAPGKPQMQGVLIPEIRSWYGKLPAAAQGMLSVLAEKIELVADPANSFLQFRTARDDSPESLQGFHQEWVLVVVDEASSETVDKIWPTLEGVLSDPNPCIIMVGNPLRNTGIFHDIHTKMTSTWKCWKVSVLDIPRRNRAMAESVRLRHGENSNAYRVQVLGEFPLAEDDTVCPWDLVEAAKQRDVDADPLAPWIWGVDVARYGDDASALCKRQGRVVAEPVKVWRKLDIMQTTGVVKAEWDACHPSQRPMMICVDANGVGAGVADRLKEMGLPVRAIMVSELPAINNKRYYRLRDELWWKAREWLATRMTKLPQDDTLGSELIGPRYTFRSSGEILVESKADMKKRGFDSPNAADAFCMTFAADAAVAMYGGFGGVSSKEPLRRGLMGMV